MYSKHSEEQNLIKVAESLYTKKKVKIIKRSQAFKGYASSYDVEILNFLNPELQLKDTELKRN